MSLGAALAYPFRHGNYKTIQRPALFYGFIWYIMLVASAYQAAFLIIVASFLNTVLTVFIGGYYIQLIKKVSYDDETLPMMRFTMQDFITGIASIIATYIYLLLPMMIITVIFPGVAAPLFEPTVEVGTVLRVGLRLVIWLLPLLVMQLALFVAIVRFWQGGLLRISQNLHIAMTNLSLVGALMIRIIGLSILLIGLSVVTGLIIGLLFSGIALFNAQLTALLWLTFAPIGTALGAASVVALLPFYHLLGRFKQQLNIYEEPTYEAAI